jgi:SAM-dependent methyltransferase
LRERVLGLGGALPFVDGSFDLVTANMVVEHVRDPRSFLADVHRVLRPGGAFLLHTPNRSYYLVWLAARIPEAAKRGLIYLLDTRREKDVFPTFYRMNTPARIQRLAEECGFHVERLSVQGSSGSFGRLGPLGWLECVILKLNCAVSGGRFQSNLLAILRRR